MYLLFFNSTVHLKLALNSKSVDKTLDLGIIQEVPYRAENPLSCRSYMKTLLQPRILAYKSVWNRGNWPTGVALQIPSLSFIWAFLGAVLWKRWMYLYMYPGVQIVWTSSLDSTGPLQRGSIFGIKASFTSFEIIDIWFCPTSGALSSFM